MTAAPGALGTDVGPEPPRSVGTPMARDLTAMIHRVVAGCSVVGLVPGLLQLLVQGPAWTGAG